MSSRSIFTLLLSLLTFVGCYSSHRGDARSQWIYAWRGQTSNLYGSEQSRDMASVDAIYAPSVRWWRADQDVVVVVSTGSSSPILILQFPTARSSVELSGSTTDATLRATLIQLDGISPEPLLDRIEESWPEFDSVVPSDPVIMVGMASGSFGGEGKLARLSVDLASSGAMPLDTHRYEGLESRFLDPLGDAPGWYERRTRQQDRYPSSIRGMLRGCWVSGRPGLSI